MWNSTQDAYLESRILSADPLELVRLLYQACTGAVRDARRHLEAGEIAARSRSITRAWDILTELGSSLDHERGGEISQRLGVLYDYMQSRLIQANVGQNDAPLAEVLGLLATLGEAWDGAAAQSPPTVDANDGAWSQLPASEPASYGSHNWSL